MDPGDPPNPGIKPRSPAMQADSLLSELSGKAKNTGGGSLALLQGNFLTQESNQGLLLCRRILYQLSYEGVGSSDSEKGGRMLLMSHSSNCPSHRPF